MRSLLRRSLLARSFLGALAALLLTAQNAFGLDPARAVIDYRLDEWTPQQGVPYAAVRCLQQDSRGYLWIGTRGGLGRFDGVSFSVVTSAQLPELKDDEIFDLASDADGNLWAATRNGVLRQISGRWERVAGLESLNDTVVRGLARHGPDGMVIATDREVHLLRQGKRSSLPLTGIQFSDTINAVRASRDGSSVLVLSQPSCLLRDGQAHALSEVGGLALREVRDAIEDDDGSWLIASTSGLFRLRGSQLEVVSQLGGHAVEATRSLLRDRDGNLWIGTPNGAYRYSHGQVSPVLVRGEETLSNILCIDEDHEGNLWFGTDSGIVRLSDVKFTNLSRRHGMTATSVLSLLPTGRDSFWVGTWGGGLNRVRDGRVVETLRKRDGLLEDAVLSLEHGPNGGLWIGYYSHGLSLFRDGVLKNYGEELGPRFRVQMLSRERSGHLWVLTPHHGLLYLKDDVLAPVALPELPPTTVLHVDSQDRVWVGGAGALGYLTRGERAWINVMRSPSGAPYSAPQAIAEDPRGHVWVARDGPGLFRIRGGEVLNRDLPQAYGRLAYSALVANGRLLLGFRNGVAQATLAQWDEWIEGRTDELQCEFFNQTDGMRSAAPNAISGRATQELADGRIAFATSKGVAILDPNRLYRNVVPPRTVIERLVIDRTDFNPDGNLVRICPERNEVAFHFTALSLKDSPNNRFRYQLVGVDKDWVEAGHRREAHYGGLAPGRYEFQVQGSNNEGLWSLKADVVAFELLPHWHETPWARALAILLPGAVLALIFWRRARVHRANEKRLLELVEWRTRDLKTAKENAEEARNAAEAASRAKSDFVANISHEIRTPMNGVLGMTELALNLAKDAEQVNYLKRVLSSGESLLVVINDILDFSKIESGQFTLDPQPFALPELVESVLDTLAVKAERQGLDLVVDLDAHLPKMVLGDGPRLRQILLNLVGNALKFTEKGTVELTVERLATQDGCAPIRFTVRDSGIGIAPERLPHIFRAFVQADTSTSRRYGGTGLGLTISQSLATRMGGPIRVTSEVGRGSQFTFAVPFAVVEECRPIERDARPGVARVTGLPKRSERMLVALLEERGWQVAIRDDDPILKQYPVSRVFVDVRQPDSRSLISTWRARGAGVVAVAPLEMPPSLREELLAQGAGAFLQPPLTRARVGAALSQPAVAPLSPTSASSTPPVAPAGAPSSPSALSILVAEDTEVNQLLVLSLLRKAGHLADLAQNGAEAVELYQKKNYDIVLMDVQMPGMDGFEATARIRTLEKTSGRHVPIIALTAHAMAGYAEHCMRMGMDDYLAKPVKSARLRELIAQHCRPSAPVSFTEK